MEQNKEQSMEALAEDLREVMEGLHIEPSNAVMTDEFLMTVGIINLQGFDVTVGIKLENLDDDGIGLVFKSAICSQEDTFDEDLGSDILYGRLIKTEGQQAITAGIAVKRVVKAFMTEKLFKLNRALAEKVKMKSMQKSVEILSHNLFSDMLEDLV